MIVLPNVYMNVARNQPGPSLQFTARAGTCAGARHSADDQFFDMIKRDLVSSRVVYDRNGQQAALVKSRLFDDLFYLGRDCPPKRISRDSSSLQSRAAIDPYLDDDSGPALLERAVNDNAAASAFGGARIYVPMKR